MIRPDLVLFNGGFFTPPVARERVAQALSGWFGEIPRLLAAGNLEAAVAIGAATYARLRAGIGRAGSLVKAGSGRAYYIALGAPEWSGSDRGGLRALAGTEEGTERTFDHPFTVVRRIVPYPSRSSARRRVRIALATSSLLIPTWTPGHMRRSLPYSASGASRVTSSSRFDCRSRSQKSARWTYGADRRRPTTDNGCSFRCGALREEMDEAEARGRRVSRARS
jgi:hypothetical protein